MNVFVNVYFHIFSSKCRLAALCLLCKNIVVLYTVYSKEILCDLAENIPPTFPAERFCLQCDSRVLLALTCRQDAWSWHRCSHCWTCERCLRVASKDWYVFMLRHTRLCSGGPFMKWGGYEITSVGKLMIGKLGVSNAGSHRFTLHCAWARHFILL